VTFLSPAGATPGQYALMGWLILVAGVLILTGAVMNAASRVAKESPGDLANNPYGWAGSKFWRLGVVLIITIIVVALVQAAFD